MPAGHLRIQFSRDSTRKRSKTLRRANPFVTMNNLPPAHETPKEPKSDTVEKPEIRKSQEEFIDDMARPSMDKSEYERSKAEPGRAPEGEHPKDAN